MTPRNTQLGASASARKAPVRRGASGASSARTPKARTPASPRASSAPSSSARTAASSKASGSAKAKLKRDASWFRWWLLPLLVVAVAAIFVVTYYPLARVQYQETRHRAALQAELNSLNVRNGRLSADVARLKTPEGVEDYARSQLGMVKRGEHVVVVTEGASQPSTATTAAPTEQPDSGTETTSAPTGPWTAFLDAFFKVQ